MSVHFDCIKEGFSEILKVVARHPKHVIAIVTSDTNPYCRTSMLRKLLSSRLPLLVSKVAGINQMGIANGVVIGYAEAVHELMRNHTHDLMCNDEETMTVAILRDLTVFTPEANGLEIAPGYTAVYVPFVQSLKIGDKVHCIINGDGTVTESTTNCCDNDNVKPGERLTSILTVRGMHPNGAPWYGTYADDGTNISQAYVGRTLRPVTD